MLVTPRHLDLSKVTKKKEAPVIKKAPKKVEPKVEAPRKPIEEEEIKIDFSFDDEENK